MMFSLVFRRSVSRTPAFFNTSVPLQFQQQLQTRTFLTASAPRHLAARTTTATKKSEDGSGAKAKITSTKAKSATKAKAASKPKTKAQAKPKPKPKAAPKPKVKKIVKPPRVKVTREELPPKRPGSSYILYSYDYRAAHPTDEKSVTAQQEFMKRIGTAWNELSDAEKAPYAERARTELAAYKIEYDKWAVNVRPEVFKEINKKRAKRGQPKLKKPLDPGLPKRPLNGWTNFLREFVSQHPEITDGNQSDRISKWSKAAKAVWDNMPEEEKNKYNEPYRLALKDYKDKVVAHKAALKELEAAGGA